MKMLKIRITNFFYDTTCYVHKIRHTYAGHIIKRGTSAIDLAGTSETFDSMEPTNPCARSENQ